MVTIVQSAWFWSFAWDAKMQSQYYEHLKVIHLFNKHFLSDHYVRGTRLDVWDAKDKEGIGTLRNSA